MAGPVTASKQGQFTSDMLATRVPAERPSTPHHMPTATQVTTAVNLTHMAIDETYCLR
jgi:hypothetical protein